MLNQNLLKESTFDITGFIDPHLHAAPEHIPRLMDDISVAMQARDAGLAGFLLKSHTTLTADRAVIASKVVPGIRIWGGLVLNDGVGGFNPAAVEVALSYGASEVWLPTLSAANHRRFYSERKTGLSFQDSDATHEIMELIASKDVILGTGHLSVQEIRSVVGLARQHGVRKILITHPEAPFIEMPVSVQLDLASLGCLFERTWVFTTPALGRLMEPATIMQNIKSVGFETTVLATDMGQVGNPTPIEGLREYCMACRKAGFTEAQVKHMGTQISDWLS